AAHRRAPDLRDRLDRVRAGPHRPALDAYRLSLRAAVEDHLAAGGRPRNPDHLLFHLVHLTNNRLGVRPVEEAVLARWIHAEQHAAPTRGAC
ncbi:lantibiotic dehydratase C-terminal domain-containing protein, partial [Streptomyces bambusae]